MSNIYYQNLIQCVLDASASDNWKDAVLEWSIVDCEEDESCSSSCVCGKENLRYLFTIRNDRTGKFLYPIGSTCIKKFERADLDEEVNIKVELYHLAHAIRKGEYIELNSQYFSRKLLRALWEMDAFPGNRYNKYDGFNDYQFLLDMYNKKYKDDITKAQKKKIGILIGYTIKPFLQKNLKYIQKNSERKSLI